MSEMRLASLTICNFQYWDFLELDLTGEHGRTYRSVALFGEQGSGKSTIARALRWLAYGHLGLGPDQTLPSAWGGNPKADQTVRAKFVRRTASGNEQEIVLERRRSAGERSLRRTIEVLGPGGGKFVDEDAASMWPNFVGHAPKAHEGALWVVRRDEMEKIHKSLTDDEGQGYLLQFFNQEEVLEKIASVISDLEDELHQLVAAAGKHDALTDQYTTLRKLLEQKTAEMTALEEELTEADALVARNELTKEEKARLSDAVKIHTLRAKEASYRKELAELELGRDDLKQVVNGTLAALLIDEGHGGDIPDNTLADEFDWDSILLRLDGLLSEDSKRQIRRLASAKRGLDLSGLRRAVPVLEDTLTRVVDLRSAKANLRHVRAQLKAFDAHEVTDQTLQALELRDEVYKDAVRRSGTLRVAIEELREEMVDIQERHDHKAEELTKAADAEQGVSQCGAALTAAKQLRGALRRAEKDYRSDMFNAALVKLREYWGKTTTSDVFEPALSERNKSIVLRKIDTAEEYQILLEDQGHGPSSGESEQLLVCMAMALADQARVQMPLILDDVHTRMDNRTRPAVFQIATEAFDQVVFVTNDNNKLAELEPFIEAVVRLKKARLSETPRSTDVYPNLCTVEER